jgi:glycerophosphoryl diester phosphodiesterase
MGAMTAVFAHRGCTDGHTENTIEAFLEAHLRGADGVEFDVRRSADGALVIHHDALVEGIGLINETAVADLPAHVALFSATIEACGGMQMNVEIKNKPGDSGYDPTGSLSREVAAELVEHGRLDGVIVSSFDAPTIEAVRAAEPALPIGWLLEVTANLPTATATALDRHYQALHPFFVAVTSDFVEACHAGGLAVNVWTPNADAHIEAMLDAGVDALITDRLSAALDLVARRAQESGPEANGGPHSG